MSKADLLPRGKLFDPTMKLAEMQKLPLSDKIVIARKRIAEWYYHHGGKVYVSFSGGKDSTVLLHIARTLFPDMRAVFFDTGLEYPEVRDFVLSTPNIDIHKPTMAFADVIKKHGYPVISKEQAQYIQQVREGTPTLARYRLMGAGGFCISQKWRYLIRAPFKISAKCCTELKKKPARLYERETGLSCIVGTMAEDSRLRLQQFLRYGCNAYDAKTPMSKPLSIWLERDIWEYLRAFNVPYSKIYDMGYTRTGCMFCAFGAHMENAPNRFQRMANTHPAQYRYCMEKLGMREVLKHIGVPTTEVCGFPCMGVAETEEGEG